MSSIPINLGVPDFAQHPDLLISVLLAAILDALQAHNAGGYDLTDIAISDEDWAARHPGVVPPPLRYPAYTPITQQMTQPQSKAAEESNRIHTSLHGAVEAIKAALIQTMGAILAYSIMDNAENGFRAESLGHIIAKLKLKFNNPSDATISQMINALIIWNPQLSYVENISLFKRKLAFLVAKGRIAGIADQIAALYALLRNAGSPVANIAFDFQRTHPGHNWAITATGTTLVPLYTYLDEQFKIYPTTALGTTAGSLGYGNNTFGMPLFHPMPHMPASHPAMQTHGTIGYYGFGLGHALGMPPALNANAAPHIPIVAPRPRQYCFAHGYDAGHSGMTCDRMNNRHFTDDMRACNVHRTLETHDGGYRHGNETNLSNQPWY